jgi:hypothetical protein
VVRVGAVWCGVVWCGTVWCGAGGAVRWAEGLPPAHFQRKKSSKVGTIWARPSINRRITHKVTIEVMLVTLGTKPRRLGAPRNPPGVEDVPPLMLSLVVCMRHLNTRLGPLYNFMKVRERNFGQRCKIPFGILKPQGSISEFSLLKLKHCNYLNKG